MFAGQEVGLVLVILALVLFVSVLVVILLRRLPRNTLGGTEFCFNFNFPSNYKFK